ncbi:MAG TPA: hypothetical protein VFZ66_03515 [Herpetosiphonaceae bacterium]
MITAELTTPPLLLTSAERAALREAAPGDHPLLDAAAQQADALPLFLTQLAELLRAGQADLALAQLDAALAPVAALDGNADGLTATLGELMTAWATLMPRCPDGRLPVAVLTDPGALRSLADAAEAVSEHAQELALRLADRARLLDERLPG